MEWVLLALGAALVFAFVSSRRRETQQRELAAADAVAKVRKVAEEDVTRFGEELMALDADTLTTTMDQAMRQDYQRALDAYDNASTLLRDVRQPDDVTHVTQTLEDGRYALACVRARAEGEPLPQRRPPCFFNPGHGPAQADAMFAPPGGQAREVPVCLADADRLAHGAEPDTRQVRDGNRMVPWYQGGPAYRPYAGGYYGSYAMSGLFPAFILGSMLGGGWGGNADGSYADGFADGQAEGSGDGTDAGGDGGDGGDAGGDWGGDAGGGDFGGDFGGGFGDFGGF